MISLKKLKLYLEDENGKEQILECETAGQSTDLRYTDLEFGELIKRIRKDANMTQEELVRLSGVGINTISSLENGKRNISEKIMKKLIKALDFDLVFAAKPREAKAK